MSVMMWKKMRKYDKIFDEILGQTPDSLFWNTYKEMRNWFLERIGDLVWDELGGAE